MPLVVAPTGPPIALLRPPVVPGPPSQIWDLLCPLLVRRSPWLPLPSHSCGQG